MHRQIENTTLFQVKRVHHGLFGNTTYDSATQNSGRNDKKGNLRGLVVEADDQLKTRQEGQASSCGGLKWRTRSVREPSRSSVQV